VLGAVLAVETSCDLCTDEHDQIVVLMPPADGVTDESFFADACEQECSYSIACEPAFIPLQGGREAPGLVCTEPAECGSGRRPKSWHSPRQRVETDGAWLVRATQLEEASVTAFRELAGDLARLRAPRRLVQAARRSAREERRHGRVLAALARRWGRCPEALSTPATAGFALEALARTNAVEGCVRETYGAALALWQSRQALDPLVRTAMRRLSVEEARHAALAWQIDAWARRQLHREQRLSIDVARRTAVAEVLAGAGSLTSPVLGLPGPREARMLAVRVFERFGLAT
jgi:hypothetical protein